MIPVRIPHAAPVRVLADAGVLGDGWFTVAARVPADGPLAAGGRVRPEWLIEIAAQACAAADGAEAAGAGAPRGGMLVAVRDWQWLADAPCDRALAVRVRREAALGALARFATEIAVDGAPCARGTLQVARA